MVRWVSITLIVVSVLLIFRRLPVESAVRAMQGWIEDLGVWGPVVFGLIYVAAVVLLVPAWALTVAAGALFGLVVGTITVSLASTTGVALTFLIARYLARKWIAKQVKQYPKFDAIDQAISDGGWKIVAMLRLSPAIPFNVQNYLYGLTGIRFWTCVLTSWAAMLPGTFLYVYLGHVGRAGVEAVAGSGTRTKSTAEWAMTIVGLLATLAVTVYVTRLARKAISERADLSRPKESTAKESRVDDLPEKSKPSGWPWGTTITAAIALLALVAAGLAQFRSDLVNQALVRLFGPPRVTLQEAYEEKPGSPSFDHSLFDSVVGEYVDDTGWVDYRGLKQDAARLDTYIQSLADVPFDDLGRNEKLAMLINAYNAFTLRLILDHYPVKSITHIPRSKQWNDPRWRIGSHTWSLSEIEQEQIRPKFREPRVHFALVCAAVGCPPLRNEAYTADRLEEQLEDQAEYVHSYDRWFQFGATTNVARLTSIYNWYDGDFEQVAGSVLNFAARYSPELKRALDAGRKPKIQWLDYGWSLNSKENAR